MSEQQKTLSFVGVAGVTLLIAVATYFMTQPAQSTGFELVGEEFFAEFEGGSQAGALEVRAIDPDSATLSEFRVEENDGVWTIPSHYGYPAEAAERLAETSSSLIGLKREALVGRLETDYERFGVVDPLDEGNLDPDSAGKRITIKDKDGEVVVDLIIGNRADDSTVSESPMAAEREQQTASYYVRHPEEKQTFKVSLDLELSTRFSDWIKPDLLELDSSDVRRIDIDNYNLVEESDPLGRFKQLFKKQGDQMNFSRDTGFGPWTMAGLDAEAKDLDSGKIDTALRTLDNLKIAGVRKKMAYKDQQLLTPDLKVVEIEALTNNPQLFNQVMGQLQQELADYGFNLTRDPNTQETICVSDAGEIAIGRENGIVYTMQFGKPVSGDDKEIEIGISSSEGDQDEEQNNGSEANEEGVDSDVEDADAVDPSADQEEAIRNRYLMIRVSFDDSLLGDQPQPPVEPEQPSEPEGYVAAEDVTENQDDKAPAPEGTESGESGEKQEDADSDDRPQAFKDYDAAMAEYKQSKTEYELKKTQFEESLKEFDQRVADGKKLVDELNERFGKWFYVISGDNLEAIQLKNDDLVTDKPAVEGDASAAPGNDLPGRPNINLEDLIPTPGDTTGQDGNLPTEEKSSEEASSDSEQAGDQASTDDASETEKETDDAENGG